MGGGCAPGSAATPSPFFLCGTPRGAAGCTTFGSSCFGQPRRGLVRHARSSGFRVGRLVRAAPSSHGGFGSAGLRAGRAAPSTRFPYPGSARVIGLRAFRLPAATGGGSTVPPSLRPSGRTSPACHASFRGCAAVLAPQRGDEAERLSKVETQESIGLPQVCSTYGEQRTRRGEQGPEAKVSPVRFADVLDRASERVAKRSVAPHVTDVKLPPLSRACPSAGGTPADSMARGHQDVERRHGSGRGEGSEG